MVEPLDPPGGPQQQSSGSGLLYAAIGCAVFLFVALIAATGLGIWFFFEEREAAMAAPVGPGTYPPGYEPPKPQPGGPMMPGPGPNLPPPPVSPSTPRVVSATVTAVGGSAPVAVGTTCSFNVTQEPRPDIAAGYWCRTQIVCGGRLLYGGPSSGYFPCTMSASPTSIVGGDTETTKTDTDAAMSLDTNAQTLTLEDDGTSPNGAYSLTARIDRVL